MIALLKPLFPGALAPYGETLACAPERPDAAMGVAQLLNDPDLLGDILQRHASHRGVHGPDLRAAASAWSMEYLQILLPPVVAAASVLQHRFPMRAHQVAVSFDASGSARRFFIADIGNAQPGADTASRYGDLLFQHLQPLFSAIQACTHLPLKILWGNAARYLDVVLTQARQLAPHAALIKTDRAVLLDQAYWPDGRANPLYPRLRLSALHSTARACDNPPHRQCCLYYRLPGETWCKRCPLAPWINHLKDSTPRA